MIGGFYNTKNLNSIEKYPSPSPGKNQKWALVDVKNSHSFKPVYWFGCTLVSRNQILIVGGKYNGKENDCCIFDTDGNSMEPFPAAPVGIYFYCMPAPVYDGNAQTVYAYARQVGHHYSTFKLDLPTKTWTQHGDIYKLKKWLPL